MMKLLPPVRQPKDDFASEMNSSALSNIILRRTPINLLENSPIINIDALYTSKVEYTSVYVSDMYKYFKDVEQEEGKIYNYLNPKDPKDQSLRRAQTANKYSSNKNENSNSTLQEQEDKGKYRNFLTGPMSKLHRSLAIELLITITHQCGHEPETLYMAVNILDRYLCKKMLTLPDKGDTNLEKTKPKKFSFEVEIEIILSGQLCGIAMSALAIAQKFEQGTRLSFSDLLPLVRNWERILCGLYESKDLEWPNQAASSGAQNKRGSKLDVMNASYIRRKLDDTEPQIYNSSPSKLDISGKKAIVRIELQILKDLDWQIKVPTLNTFLKRYAIVGQLNKNMLQVACCLCDRVLLEYEMLFYQPSLVAASIVLFVRLLYKLDGWTSTLQCHSGYLEDELSECIRDLQATLLQEENDRLEKSQQFVEEVALNEMENIKVKPKHKKVILKYIPGDSVCAKWSSNNYRALLNLPKDIKSSSDEPSTLANMIKSDTARNCTFPLTVPPLIGKVSSLQSYDSNSTSSISSTKSLQLNQADILNRSKYDRAAPDITKTNQDNTNPTDASVGKKSILSSDKIGTELYPLSDQDHYKSTELYNGSNSGKKILKKKRERSPLPHPDSPDTVAMQKSADKSNANSIINNKFIW